MTRFNEYPPKDRKPDVTPYGQGTTLNSDKAIWRKRIEFLEKYMASFRELSEHDDDNHPGMRIEMFTVLTQHIYGRSVTECIDKGIGIENKEKDKDLIRKWNTRLGEYRYET